uniref:OsmC-like protein n=1 Tax=Rhizochromulina marina TaxID=1034831 RepID=A0A7S2WHP5_9STRA|mmetsp:Transcript_2468/g.7223  ORF Transcript_2468/g.7223 Transcript_2468/m.7223 type:complete len:177 (+) Transcript_2468:1-531(+)
MVSNRRRTMMMRRLLPRLAARELRGRSMSTVVVKTTPGISPYTSRIQMGPHSMVVDEPPSLGGADLGPNPYDVLLASLGSCTSITLEMYAKRKAIPLEEVEVTLDHAKVYAQDCEDCSFCDDVSPKQKIDKIDRVIRLIGPELTEEHKAVLMKIADKCPVHNTLHSPHNIISSRMV